LIGRGQGVYFVDSSQKDPRPISHEDSAMTGNRKFLAYALSTAFGLVAAVSSANAACVPTGNWSLTGITVSSPTNTNTKSNSISCTVIMNASGVFSNAACKSYHSQGGAPSTTTASGHLTISACNITGTITVAGDPTPITIQAGRIFGTSAAFITTQGKSVGHFTLIR
jgi:hypothetical protein